MAFLGHPVRDHRLRLMREMMDRDGLDALAFTGADFFQFATNFATDVLPWERPILCVVPRDGAPFAVLNELSTNHWRYAAGDRRLWVTEAHFYAEHPRAANRLPLASQWPDLVAGLLRRAGLASARIGTEGSAPLSHAAGLLPRVRLEGATDGMRALRWVKHADEIALMREIAALSDWVQDRYREAIRPGRMVQEMDMAMATRGYA